MNFLNIVKKLNKKRYRVCVRDEENPPSFDTEKARFKTRIIAIGYQEYLLSKGYGARIEKIER